MALPGEITRAKVDKRRHPQRKPPPAIKPTRGVFGPLGRADNPLAKAQRQAHQRTRNAQRRLPERPLPSIPTINRPTRRQNQAAISLTRRSTRNLTPSQRRDLSQDPRSRAKLRPAQRAVRSQQRALNLRTGKANQPRPVYGPPTPTAPFTQVDALKRSAVVRPRYLPTGRDTLRAQGSQVSTGLRSELLPGREHTRVGLPGATVDITTLSKAVQPYAARSVAIPAAFAKGLSDLAQIRPLSDKGVLTRTINDALTYPAAAIPTGYQAITHPRDLASAILDQVTHPIATTKEHPLFGAMLLHGGVAAVGRGTGAIARSGALGPTAARAGSLERPALALAGTQGSRLVEQRRYNPSLAHKAVQVAADRRRAVVGTHRGRPVVAARPREQERLLKQRGDFVASRANAVERMGRQEEAIAARGTAPKRGRLGKFGAKREREVVAMAMEGTLRSPETFKADLLKERQRLEDSYRGHHLDPAQKHTNRVRARSIDRVLKDPKALANADEVFRSARELAQRGNERSAEAVSLGMLDPAAAERAKLFPYAQSHMGAKPVEHSDGTVSLRAGDGTFLSNEQISAHMADPNTGPVLTPQDLSYLPHRVDVRGARAFHAQFRPGQRKNLDLQHRTGSAYEKGATAADFEQPVEHLVRQSNLIGNVKEHDRLIHDAGIKRPDGELFTWDEAQQYARRANRAPNEATNRAVAGEPDLVPVRAFPAKYSAERQRQIQDELQDPTKGTSGLLEQSFLDRLKAPSGKDTQARNVVLVPRVIVDRLAEQLQPSTRGARGFQAATGAFRTTVLPFSTKWLTGNVAEAVLRLGAVGAHPGDVAIGKRLLSELTKADETAAKQTKAHLTGGLLYGERSLTNRRTAADVSRGLGTVAHAPVVRELGATLKAVTGGIFAINRAFEQGAQHAALGKYARREVQAMTGSWRKAVTAQRQALKDVAKGLTDTEAQHAAAKYLDETLGKYSRFSPTTRHIIQTYAPFLPWYLNAARFVAITLPLKHPIKTAVLTQAEAAFQKDWEDQHKGVPPGLKPAIPSKGGYVDVARYTPFGLLGPAFSGETESLAGIVLPQTSGIQAAFLGNDPFGGDLVVPPTTENPRGRASGGQKLLVGLNTAAEAYIPGLGLIRRSREGGRKPYSTSTAFSPKTQEPKAGQPQVSAANRILNPVRPVYVSPGRESSPAKRFQSKYGVKGSKLDKASFQKKYGVKSAGMSKEEFQVKYGVGK